MTRQGYRVTCGMIPSRPPSRQQRARRSRGRVRQRDSAVGWSVLWGESDNAGQARQGPATAGIARTMRIDTLCKAGRNAFIEGIGGVMLNIACEPLNQVCGSGSRPVFHHWAGAASSGSLSCLHEPRRTSSRNRPREENRLRMVNGDTCRRTGSSCRIPVHPVARGVPKYNVVCA